MLYSRLIYNEKLQLENWCQKLMFLYFLEILIMRLLLLFIK